MKKILFGLLATFLFSFSGNAQKDAGAKENEKMESAIMTVKSGGEIIKYKFSTVKDFEENTDRILDDITSSALTGNIGDKCEVTVEASITVNTGILSTTVAGTTTTSCAAIAAMVKKIRAQLIAAII